MFMLIMLIVYLVQLQKFWTYASFNSIYVSSENYLERSCQV